MCLGVPGRLVVLRDGGRSAVVDAGGVRREVSLALLAGGPPAVGEWVLVHVGFALARIDEASARATLSALDALGDGGG